MDDDSTKVSMICEQGDMGLWNTELSEEDQKKLDDDNKKNTKVKEEK